MLTKDQDLDDDDLPTTIMPAGLPQVAPKRRSLAKDLSGLFRLSTEAVHKTTEVVEAQHSRLDWFGNLLFSDKGQDKARNPIAAMVYNSIYKINGMVGTSMEFVVSNVLEPLLGEEAPSQRKEAAIAILNGVVGDYLEAQHNPLAIEMQWRTLEDSATSTTATTCSSSSSTKKHYLLLIHGSCNSPHDWWQEGHNHGIAISHELDTEVEPLFLQFNTGLHISENGKRLSQAIQQLVDNNNSPASSEIHISIIAHSMGGLVARSACYYASQEEDNDNTSTWIQHLDHLITLGTPHHGAILERGGKLVDAVLGAHRFTEPLSWLGKIRSDGVMDLGYGNVRDEDWSEHDDHTDHRQPTPLPSHVRTLAIAAVKGDANNRAIGMIQHLRTDGLVTEDSALGRGHAANPELNLVFQEHAIFYNLGHIGLLSSLEVYKTMLCFLSS